MTRRATLLNTDFGGLKLPPDVLAYLGKSQVTKTCGKGTDMEIHVLPT
jgi:hypothetical protein